jgi:carbamoyltransferase
LTAILGISAFYHDSAAALIVDGEIVAAAQEERFSRIKHDAGFPARAVAWCLADAKLRPEKLDWIAFYEKPLCRFERLLETYLAFAPHGFGSFCKALPLWLKDKLFTRRAIRRGVGAGKAPLVFLEHHESHAASAFFPSPFEEAAILTLDGVGEWATATQGVGEGNHIRLTHQMQFPHSLGLLYSAFTYYCGFKVNSGEYKLMGLAPFGTPVYVDVIRRHLVDIKPDGSFWLNMAYFNYCQGLTMTNRRFDRLFGGPPREPETRIEQRHMDLAASIQAVTGEIVLKMARDLHRNTGQKNLTLAGGVALNCVANGRLLREGPFESIWIQPAAGDAGGALGAALFVWHQLLRHPRPAGGHDRMRGSLLGCGFATEQIEAFLQEIAAPHRRFADDGALVDHVAEELAQGKVIGWFQGRMEFGPRALGARSILGDPRSPHMQAALNRKIKFREGFRPFAPAVLSDCCHEWFDLPGDSPYMLLVAPVHERHRRYLTPEQQERLRSDANLCGRVNVVRSTVPAVTHVDYSARLQTVDGERHPRFVRLLRAFERRTGCPMLINTSFNVRGEPIVCTPQEAYRCFLATDIDALVLENCLVYKTEAAPHEQLREAYLAQFHAD